MSNEGRSLLSFVFSRCFFGDEETTEGSLLNMNQCEKLREELTINPILNFLSPAQITSFAPSKKMLQT